MNITKNTAVTLQFKISDTTGKLLPYYGDKALKQTTRFNDSNLPVSADYEISAGDEILVRAWGGIEINQATTVDRDGQLDIPRVGTFPVAGVKARDLNNYLKAEIGKFYKNFEISATLGKLSGVSIYVAGQALAPGLHTVSSTSTLAWPWRAWACRCPPRWRNATRTSCRLPRYSHASPPNAMAATAPG